MRRRLEKERDGETLVIATHNKGKLREINELVEPYGFTALSAGALGLPEPVEDGTTYIENARIKALAAATASGKPALADDSGISVDALHGAPGIFSARWAVDKDFGAAMSRVEDELRWRGALQNPKAHFVSALTIAWPDGHMEDFEGTVHGILTFPARGTHGFGYDPIFVPEGHSGTFGEMDPTEKNLMSHRADAFKQLAAVCLG